MVSTTKLVVVATLGAVAIVLGSAAISLSVILHQRKGFQLENVNRTLDESSFQQEGTSTSSQTSTTSPPTSLNQQRSSSSSPYTNFHPHRDLHSHRRLAPHETDPITAADAHLSSYLRLTTARNPFQDDAPLFSATGLDFDSDNNDNRGEAGDMGGFGGRFGMGFVRGLRNSNYVMGFSKGSEGSDKMHTNGIWHNDNDFDFDDDHGNDDSDDRKLFWRTLSSTLRGTNSLLENTPPLLKFFLAPFFFYEQIISTLLYYIHHFHVGISSGGNFVLVQDENVPRPYPNIVEQTLALFRSKREDGNAQNSTQTRSGSIKQPYSSQKNDTLAEWHLHQSANLGNPHAQYLLANALASGVGVTPSSLPIPAAFGEGKSQLSNALILYHMSAMENIIESQMALGYRYYAGWKGNPSGAPKSNKQNKINALVDYGVEGSCEMALSYYEAAANLAMDEMESSPLRGKLFHASDKHQLYAIHASGGASSALSSNNKPDELEEALEYYRLRAVYNKDVDAAFTLGNLHQHGHRGVNQDMRRALKYYKMAAEYGGERGRQGAGQVGRMYLLGMGCEVSITNALKYFELASPGGIESCTRAARDQQASKQQSDKLDEELDGGNMYVECDAEAMNGLGLMHLFGQGFSRDVSTAVSYFQLAREAGHADAAYNIAMLRMGWMNFDDITVATTSTAGSTSGTGAMKPDAAKGNAAKASAKAGKPDKFIVNKAGADADYLSKSAQDDNDNLPLLDQEKIAKGDISQPKFPPLDNDADTNPTDAEILNPLEDQTQHMHTSTTKKIRNRSPIAVDYVRAMAEFTRAANKGHPQSLYRVGIMFAKGIGTPKNCAVATKYLKQIAESSPSISRKLRSGYRRYKSGQYEAALRNYMSAAEAGIELAQSNAAWLLERGNCLNLDKENCVRASVRYWKASTRQGNMEAGLHVGDFHYFGKLGVVLQPKQLQATKNGSSSGVVGNEKSKLTSSNDGSGLKSSSNSDPLSTWWPFMIEYITQPDVWIARSRASLVQMVRTMMRWGKKKQQRKNQNTASTNDNAGVIESSNQNVADEQELSSEKYKSCKADQNAADGTAATACLSDVKRQQHDDANKDSTLRNKTSNRNNIRSTSQSFERDFFSAAQYYRSAAEMGSPRGNYNLGFMYEWGLGLKQDFPLAKRHYDLAADNNPQAELAVQLTLTSMKLHERLVKLCNWWREWNSSNDHTSADSSSSL